MISDERISDLSRGDYVGHILGQEITAMAKELLNYRPCKHNWNVLRLVEGNGRYQYCTLCGAKKVAD